MDDGSDPPEIREFDDFGLSIPLLRGCYAYGFELPSRIQRLSITVLISPQCFDLVAQGAPGTGMTASQAIAMMQNLDTEHGKLEPGVQGLLLAPTPDLASQTFRVFEGIGGYFARDFGLHFFCFSEIRALAVDIEELQSCGSGCVVIGTVDRVKKLHELGHLSFDNLRSLILDEADLLLEEKAESEIVGEGPSSSSVIEFVKTIQSCSDVQVSLFSCFYPEGFVERVKELSIFGDRAPRELLLPPERLVPIRLTVSCIEVGEEEDRAAVVCKLIRSKGRLSMPILAAVVMCNSTEAVEKVARHLISSGLTVASVHSQQDPAERNRVLRSFRQGSVRLLVAQDVSYVGFDVHIVSHMISHDLPLSRGMYLRRISRAGRYGRRAEAIDLVTKSELEWYQALTGHFQIAISQLSGDDDE